jgi:VWFA-related protein
MRLDVSMVLVPVTVTDERDHPIMDLPSNSFRLYEDEVEQRIVSFSREEGPISVGFIFDASSSMKGRMTPSLKAIEQLLKTMVPGDEFFLIRFSDRAEALTGFTNNGDDILRELSFVTPQGWTSLNDAICLGVQKMKAAHNTRRALFILTDGGDNSSRYSEKEVRSLVQESDVRVFSIGLFERPKFLERLAEDTGGRAYWVHSLTDLPDAVDKMSQEFRNQYVLGYSSRNELNDGKYRKVRVELLDSVRRLPMHVFWRRGYYAPPE